MNEFRIYEILLIEDNPRDVDLTLRALKRYNLANKVVLTSSNPERDMTESYRLGVNSYITKTVDFDQFIDCARQLGVYWLMINQVPGHQ